MASSAAADIRSLERKTNAVRRTTKDLQAYVNDLKEEEKKTEEIRRSSDHSKLKQWENVCAETQGMIPDTESRLRTALEDLNAILIVPAYEGTSALENAKNVISDANAVLNREKVPEEKGN